MISKHKSKNCQKEYKNIKYICSKNILTENLNAKNINSKNIKAKDVNATTVNAKDVNTTTVNAKDVNATNINTNDVNATTVNTTIVKTDSIETGDIIAKGLLFFSTQFYTLNVGSDKEFKSITSAISALQNRLILGNIEIQVDPGIYDGFSLNGFQILNGAQIAIIGDTRNIAASTYIKNSNDFYYEFIFTPEGQNTKIQIKDNGTGEYEKFQEMGLVSGDKVILYNNDISISKELRFSELIVISVNSDSFVVDNLVDIVFENSSITFLPNVFIKANYSNINIPYASHFPSLYNMNISNNVNAIGMTLLEPEGFSSDSSILNSSANSSFDSIVVIGKKWNSVTIDNVLYEGFSNPGAYFDGFGSSNVGFTFFTVLGTGYNPQSDNTGPISLNNSTSTSLFETYIINSVQNVEGPGLLYFFDNNATITSVAIVGTEGSIGIFLSNSNMFNSRNVLVADCLTSILAEINSKIDLESSIFQNFEIGIDVEKLSDAILTKVTFINGGQEFCIKDLSRILRDGNIVVAPSC